MGQMAQRPANYREWRRQYPFHKVGGVVVVHRQHPFRGTQSSGDSRALQGAGAMAADTCSQALMTPFPSSLPLPR